MFALYQNLYGNYRNRKFTDIWGTAAEFVNSYELSAMPLVISAESATTLYYLLYARYGNSTIASSDENQFKYKVFSIIFQYGPTWQKRLEVQDALRKMDIEELRESAKAIYNHSYNPSTAPNTDTMYELQTINDQNVTKHQRSKTDAYALLLDLLKTDVTEQFINKFQKLFLTVVTPELPLWYTTETIEGETENDN